MRRALKQQLEFEMSGAFSNLKSSSNQKFADAQRRELRKLLMKQVRKAVLGGSRIVVVELLLLEFCGRKTNNSF